MGQTCLGQTQLLESDLWHHASKLSELSLGAAKLARSFASHMENHILKQVIMTAVCFILFFCTHLFTVCLLLVYRSNQ